MLDKIPKAESLKDTMARSSVYWDEVVAPALKSGKTLLVCGHENNLRSMIMRLEGISAEDIIKLNLPRAIPLAYRLDENLKPLDRADGKLDEATGFLRGDWLSGDDAVSKILDRDHKQVYDTTIERNLEEKGSNVVVKPGPSCATPAEWEVYRNSNLYNRRTVNGDKKRAVDRQ